MSTESVLDTNTLNRLREARIISENEIAISSGDLFYAKNIISEEKRMLDASQIKKFTYTESISESTNKTLLKG